MIDPFALRATAASHHTNKQLTMTAR